MSRARKRRSLFPLLALLAATLLIVLVLVHIAKSHTENPLSEAQLPNNYASVEESFQSLPASSSTPGSLRIPIFIYHSVRPHIQGEDAENEAYDITPDLLDNQLTYLEKNGYTPISMDDFYTYVRENYSPVLHPIVLTFDDGWRNQYQYAFPLLVKHHMTATFFVYTNPIDHDKPHFLTWDMLREMDKAGMEIGSHSVTHPLLYRLTPDELYKEMASSKTRLEQELGHPVVHFATPFGSISDLIVATAKVVGYETVRTTYKGVYHTSADFLKLRGILVDDSLNDFIKVLKSN